MSTELMELTKRAGSLLYALFTETKAKTQSEAQLLLAAKRLAHKIELALAEEPA